MSKTFTDETGGEAQIVEPSTRDRETAIFQILRQPDAVEGLSIKEIAERVKDYLLHGPSVASDGLDASFAHAPKHDKVTVQAYYKLVNRLTALGRLEEAPTVGEQGERLYRLAPYIHASNPATLDDIYEWALQPSTRMQLPPSETIARAADAADYLGERKHTVLKKAAESLTQEDPRDVFFRMIMHEVEMLRHDLGIYADHGLRDPEIRARVERGAHSLDQLLYRQLGVPPEIVDITQVSSLIRDAEARSKDAVAIDVRPEIAVDVPGLREFLKRRVFGERFIYQVDAGATRGATSRRRLTVAGSDGSTHASELQVRTARAFIDESDLLVHFNNSMVYVHQPSTAPRRADYPFHSVPITRAALDDPNNRGMIMSRQMYSHLSDSVYEHMARCATDVVQWRVDAAVFTGTARPVNPANVMQRSQDFTLPAPAVHIRDGTVVPQEREFTHYKRLDEYGDMVREGQNLMRVILERLRGEDNKQVFAGAVKSTQMRLFSRVLSWYIAHGSQARRGGDGRPIDPQWEEMYAAGLSDNQSMTHLLATLVEGREDEARAGKFWVTCCVVRPFHATTEYYDQKGVRTDAEWKRFFSERANFEEKNARALGHSWLWETQDWEDDTFVYLCRRADFGMFYIGHTNGDPPPSVPRYEFLDSLRSLSSDEAAERVARNVRAVVEALDHSSLAVDSDHNFMTHKRLVKIIPYVVHRSHEACKTLGRNLETQLRDAVIAHMSRLRKLRGIVATDITLLPVSIRKYVDRMTKALREETEKDPDKWMR